MGINKNKYMPEELQSAMVEFEETKGDGRTFITGKVKYIGGHAEIAGESAGKLSVTSRGVFFESENGRKFFYIPVEAILKAASKTLDEVAKHAVFARYLALSGFTIAFKKKFRGTAIFFTVDYASYGIECSALFEAEMANAFAVATARACEEYRKQMKVKEEKEKQDDGKMKFEPKSIAELMIDINELFARGVLTPDEFAQKKRELLSRM